MSYAIFTTGGRQFRAEPGLTIKVPLLDAKPGAEVTFDHVLIASDGKQVQSGAPHVKGAKVTAKVVPRASDDSLFTTVDGQVKFEHKNKKRMQVSVYPVAVGEAAKN